MAALFAPAVAVMNRLKYPQKFALISLLFILPLALVMNLLLSEINERIEFARKELYGDQYLRPLRNLLEHVPQARRLAHSAAGGDFFRPDLMQKRTEIDEDLTALAIVDQKLGEVLKTTRQFGVLSTNWQSLKNQIPGRETQDSDPLYAKLVADIRALIAHVGDTSNLILDPDLDSYYLMDAVLLKLPEGQDLVAQIRLVGDDILTRDCGDARPCTPTAEKKARLMVLAGLLKANLDATKNGLAVAFRNNPAQNLRPVLEAPLQAFVTVTEEFLITLNTEIVQAETISTPPAAYVAAATKPLDASFGLWDRIVTELDGLLQARIDRFARDKQLVEIFVLLILMVVLYLWVAFYLAVRRTVVSLEQASQRLVSGDMTRTITLETRDELGQVAQSFNSVATRLRTEWAQAQEESTRARAAEARLRESEERYRDLVENAIDAIAIVTLDGTLISVNQAAEQLVGWSREELVGQAFAKVLTPSSLANALERIHRFLAGEAIDPGLPFELALLHREGRVIPVEARTRAIFNQEGTPIGFHGIFRDITERKRAEDALRQKTAFVQLLQEVAVAANESVTLADAMQTCLTRVCAHTGWPVGHAYVLVADSTGKLAPTTIWHLDKPEQFAMFRKVTERTHLTPGVGLPGRVLASGKPVWVMDVTEDANFPRAKAATDIGVRAAFGFPVVVGAEVVAVLEFFSDKAVEPDESLLAVMAHIGTQLGRVVERKRAEEALWESQKRYRDLFENANDAMATFTLDARITSFNRGAEIMLGWSREEVIGQHARKVATPASVVLAEERTRRFLAGEKLSSATFEAELLRNDGSVVPVEARTRALRDREGRPIGFQGVYRDITERKRAEVELQTAKEVAEAATRHKSEFLANMSHELRTPLNAIIGFSEVLLEKMFGELNDKQDEYLHDILSSGRHLLSLINDILDLSKVEAGKIELDSHVFSLRQVLEGSLVMVKERALAHGIILSLDLADDIDTVIGDERKVKQILFNLLSNAVKFTPAKGKVSLTAKTTDGVVQIAVRDTGIGIAAKDQQRIFEEFQQVGKGLTGKTEGTGLGLALTKRFVELHGGRIWVDSTPDRGSTFTFTLPLVGAVGHTTPTATQEAAATAQGTEAASAGPLVLVIEDDAKAAELLRLYLMEAGYTVALARDGIEGLEKVKQLHPDAVILDVLLPKVDGWAFLTQMKADPALKDVPVIIASIVDQKGKGFALGAAQYLVKPVHKEELLRELAALV
jgi:PAS domain S-box-containing protein